MTSEFNMILVQSKCLRKIKMNSLENTGLKTINYDSGMETKTYHKYLLKMKFYGGKRQKRNP